MNTFLKHLLITVFFFSGLNTLRAQESILDEINYVFLDSLIAKAKENYPRNKILLKQTEIAKSNISRANVSWLDALNFNYIYGNNSLFNLQNPSSLINGYQAGVNLNLGMLLEKPYRVKNAKADHKIAQLEEEEYALTIVNEVKKRYYQYIQFFSSVKVRTKASQDAEAIVQDIKYKYEKGEATFVDYNNALNTLSNNVQYKLESESSLFIAKAALEEIIGQPLEEIKIDGRK